MARRNGWWPDRCPSWPDDLLARQNGIRPARDEISHSPAEILAPPDEI